MSAVYSAQRVSGNQVFDAQQYVAGGGNATASGSFAPISISPATAVAIGSAMAQGWFPSIGITAPTGSASGAGASSATASGSFASITITAATGTASNGSNLPDAATRYTVTAQPRTYQVIK